MGRAQRRTCSERFEVRLKKSEKADLEWLCARLDISGNTAIRMAIKMLCEKERHAILLEAGIPGGQLS